MEKVKKDQAILIRVSKKEKEVISNKAKALGLSLTSYIRMKGLEGAEPVNDLSYLQPDPNYVSKISSTTLGAYKWVFENVYKRNKYWENGEDKTEVLKEPILNTKWDDVHTSDSYYGHFFSSLYEYLRDVYGKHPLFSTKYVFTNLDNGKRLTLKDFEGIEPFDIFEFEKERMRNNESKLGDF